MLELTLRFLLTCTVSAAAEEVAAATVEVADDVVDVVDDMDVGGRLPLLAFNGRTGCVCDCFSKRQFTRQPLTRIVHGGSCKYF